ncbi:DUF881 domain-containing protein [Peribacillus alkalitolerans]|uniref:DUF881 domain-containing protein n=1 Tax=Peribacillus alkalitolerans TaxID=1550385 RepID=UPI0013D82458|nr:DUF881 domain-containing protein [Peribacillus alkalitolerans]
MKRPMKVMSKHVILSIVFLVLGFMIAFSYKMTNRDETPKKLVDRSWEREYELRQQLINQEEKNRKLQNEILKKQEKITAIEQDLAKEKQVFFNMAEDTEKYRMFLGKVKVKGTGVEVVLSDGEYDPSTENINNYIVHEHHVFSVINELYISGATAIAINGQRLDHKSYIVCNGPVITVDGNQHPAPFVITAIGEPDVLTQALNLNGGVKDQLLNENIIFSMEKKDEIVLEPIIGS